MHLPKIESETIFFEYAQQFCQRYRTGNQSPTHRSFIEGLRERIEEYTNAHPNSSKFVRDCLANWTALKKTNRAA